MTDFASETEIASARGNKDAFERTLDKVRPTDVSAATDGDHYRQRFFFLCGHLVADHLALGFLGCSMQ